VLREPESDPYEYTWSQSSFLKRSDPEPFFNKSYSSATLARQLTARIKYLLNQLLKQQKALASIAEISNFLEFSRMPTFWFRFESKIILGLPFVSALGPLAS